MLLTEDIKMTLPLSLLNGTLQQKIQAGELSGFTQRKLCKRIFLCFLFLSKQFYQKNHIRFSFKHIQQLHWNAMLLSTFSTAFSIICMLIILPIYIWWNKTGKILYTRDVSSRFWNVICHTINSWHLKSIIKRVRLIDMNTCPATGLHLRILLHLRLAHLVKICTRSLV